MRHISADRLADPSNGAPYFLARVAVEPGQLEKLAPGIKLLPGMPADVMILTGERTLLEYLVDPVFRNLERGMREP